LLIQARQPHPRFNVSVQRRREAECALLDDINTRPLDRNPLSPQVRQPSQQLGRCAFGIYPRAQLSGLGPQLIDPVPELNTLKERISRQIIQARQDIGKLARTASKDDIRLLQVETAPGQHLLDPVDTLIDAG
jgi:hypothetical protein